MKNPREDPRSLPPFETSLTRLSPLRLRSVFGIGHPSVDDDRPPCQRFPVLEIALEGFVGEKKSIAVIDQPHIDLLAVQPMIARVTAGW